MNKENRQKVLDYLNSYKVISTEPLFFMDWYDRKPNISKNLSLKDLVVEIMKVSKAYASYNLSTKQLETDKCKNRSSLDIWRHVKYYKPDADIFSVMRILYKIRNGYFCTVCSNIQRRVFYLMLSGYGLVDCIYKEDEYGLTLEDWANI